MAVSRNLKGNNAWDRGGAVKLGKPAREKGRLALLLGLTSEGERAGHDGDEQGEAQEHAEPHPPRQPLARHRSTEGRVSQNLE